MARNTARPCAFAVPVLGAAELEPRDGTSTGSSYQESGSRPGPSLPLDALTRAVPVVSGEQGVDLELVTLRAGPPGLSVDAAQLGYRMVDDAAADSRGWSPPNRVTGWSTPAWSTGTDYDDHPAGVVVHPQSQRVVVVYGESAEATVYDPADCRWSTPVDIGDPDDTTAGAVLVCLPSGRLVRLNAGTARRSDDVGETWSAHAYGLARHGLGGSVQSAHAAATATEVLYVATDGTDWVQMVSYDGLASIGVVDTFDSIGDHVQVGALPAGGFVVAYVRGFNVYVRVLGLAGGVIEDLDEILVRGVIEVDSLALAIDPDGVVWLYGSLGDGASSYVMVWCSLDSGATWTELEEGAWAGASADDRLVLLGAAPSCGEVHLLHGWSGTTSTATGSLGVLRLGGWSNYPSQVASWRSGTDLQDAVRSFLLRSGTGLSASGVDEENRVWLPIERPGDNGWDDHGDAGADALSQGALRIETTGANNRWFSVYLPVTDDHRAFAAGELEVDAGGDLGTMEIALRVTTGSGPDTWGADVTLRFSGAGLRLYDEVGAEVVADGAIDTTTGPVQVAVWLERRGGDVVASALYRRPWEPVWTVLAWRAEVTDAGNPVDDDAVSWGHLDSGTAESRWRWVVASTQVQLGRGLPSGEAGDGALGRPIGLLPVPLPLETGTSTGPAWLSVLSGPAVMGDRWDVPAEYDYAVEHLDPVGSPSPAESWRGAVAVGDSGPAEVVFAYDSADGVHRHFIGDAVAVLAVGCNFRLAELERYDAGDEEWVSVGTLDLATGFATGLLCDVDGTCVTPNASTAAGARFVGEGELVGGHVLLTIGGVPTACPITANSAGVWSGSADTSTAPRVRITVSGIGDGSEEIPAGTACKLVWPSGVLVAHLDELTVARRWRVRVLQQIVPDGRFEAGVLAVCSVVALGAPHDWGWSRERSPNAETRRSRRGTSRTRKLGPTVRSASIAWTSGADQRKLRAWPGTPLDHLAAGDGLNPLAAVEDVEAKLGGLLEATDSGARPVGWLPSMPAATTGSPATTITDPALWLFGRVVSSVRGEHGGGNALDEESVIRTGAMTVEGLV